MSEGCLEGRVGGVIIVKGERSKIGQSKELSQNLVPTEAGADHMGTLDLGGPSEMS